MLISAGAKSDRVTPGNLRLVDLALYQRSLPWYELMRRGGAVVTGRSPCGLTPLQAISPQGSIGDGKYAALFSRLLEDGADPDGNAEFRPVVMAAKHHLPELLRLLKAKGANLNPDGETPPVAAAVLSGISDSRSFSENASLTVDALVDAGADLNRPFLPFAGSSTDETKWAGMTPLAMLAASLPEVDAIDRFLAFRPGAQESGNSKKTPFGYALDEYLRLRQISEESLAGQKNSPLPRNLRSIRRGFISLPGWMGGGDADSKIGGILKTAPATLRRLWEYEKVERNPEFADRVWLQIFDMGKSPPKNHFWPVGPLKSPVSLAELLIQGGGTDLIPNFTKMEILLRDPSTGRQAPDRTIDILSLASARPPGPMPLLRPGEILSLQPTEQQAGSWRDFPEPVLSWIKTSQVRRITVKAGDWVRSFKVLPELKDFRWDPETDVLSVKPTLQTVLRYLPKPAWYYRMATVRVSRPGGEAVEVHDLTQPLSPEKDPVLPDGAEISLEEVPSDDPDLVERRMGGIFISSPADGFLREVFGRMEAPDKPSISSITALNVIAAFYLESESVIPFPDMDALTVGGVPQSAGPLPNMAPGAGCTLELKRRKLDPSAPLATEFALDLSKAPPLSVQLVLAGQASRDISLVQANGIFKQTADGWYLIRQRVYSADAPWGMRSDISISSPSLGQVSDRIFAFSGENGRAWENVPRRLSRTGWPEPISFRPWGGEMPFVILRDGDRILLDPSDRRQGFRESEGQPGTTVSPAIPAAPSSGSGRRVVLPNP